MTLDVRFYSFNFPDKILTKSSTSSSFCFLFHFFLSDHPQHQQHVNVLTKHPINIPQHCLVNMIHEQQNTLKQLNPMTKTTGTHNATTSDTRITKKTIPFLGRKK